MSYSKFMNKYKLDDSVVIGSLAGAIVGVMILKIFADVFFVSEFVIAVIMTVLYMSYYFYLSFLCSDKRQLKYIAYVAMLTFYFIGLSVITFVEKII